MKKLFVLLALTSLVFALPMAAGAGIVGTATILNTGENLSSLGTYYWNYPLARITWDGGVKWHDWSLNYTAQINGQPEDWDSAYPEIWDVYCTEVQMDNPAQTTDYTLLSVDPDLGFYGLNAAAYMAAAWLADNHGYADNGDYDRSDKALAQLVIWEIIADGYLNFDLTAGSFRNDDNNGFNGGVGTYYSVPAYAMWEEMVGELGEDLSGISGIEDWVLAVNPTIQAGDQITISYAQNYLIRNPVPDGGATLMLLGMASMGLSVIRRRI